MCELFFKNHKNIYNTSKIMSKHSYDHLFKILLIGDSGVGKTSIMCRFKDDMFNPSMNMTIGLFLCIFEKRKEKTSTKN